MNDLNFTVLGRRGVGKTTLITSIYDQTVRCLSGTGINLHADLATSTQLTHQLVKLRKIADETKALVKHGGIEGTANVKKYVFSLGPDGGKADLVIRFTDFPGGWLEDPGKQSDVVEIASKADVLLVPIDSPPLMEGGGRYHDAVNVPSLIRGFSHEIQNASEAGRSRLVILAPIRCEKYTNGAGKADQLLKKVLEEYVATIECFSQDTAVVITPIQTVGCLQFSYFGKKSGDDYCPEMNFKKQRAGDLYSPVDCDQPMRYLLRFLLKQQHEAKNGGWWHWLTFGFLSNKLYLKAASEISSKCKNGTDGFKVVQGGHLL